MESLLKTLKVILRGVGLIILIPALVYYYFTDWRFPIPEDSQIVIQLTRGTALGGIGYHISLYEDGTVVYEGEQFVGTNGIIKEKISTGSVHELSKTIEQSGYFELDDSYFPDGGYDGDFVITYVKIGQKEKGVVHHTAVDIPELVSMENLIDETADTQKWVECRHPIQLFCGLNPYIAYASLVFAMIVWGIFEFMLKRNSARKG